MNRKTLLQWLPLALFAVIMLTGLRPIVLGGLQRGLLATGLWRADAPTPAANTLPVALTGGAPYPNELALTTLDGRQVSLSSLRGKTVFVNMWASWCPPCRAEMPGIEALYQKVDKSKVAFVLLSLDENPAKARAFLKSQAFTFPVYFPAGPLPAAFASDAIPCTVILGPDGRVVTRHEGMAEYDTPEFREGLEKVAMTAHQ